MVVHGSADRSRVIGRHIGEIELPEGASIVAIVRGEQVIMAHHDTRIETEDHLIVFLVRPPPHRRGRAPVPGRALGTAADALAGRRRPPARLGAGCCSRRCSCCRSAPRSTTTRAHSWPSSPAALASLAAGLAIRTTTLRFRTDLKPRDAYLLVTLTWLVLAAVATVPLLALLPQLSFTRAFFETMSGLTTTGADRADRARRAAARRQSCGARALSWLGGMGIIVMAVAILPLLGIGGMEMYRSETPGPGQGRQAHAAHRPDRAAAVVRVRRPDGAVRGDAARRRHALVRRDLPRLLGAVARRASRPTTPASATSTRR